MQASGKRARRVRNLADYDQQEPVAQPSSKWRKSFDVLGSSSPLTNSHSQLTNNYNYIQSTSNYSQLPINYRTTISANFMPPMLPEHSQYRSTFSTNFLPPSLYSRRQQGQQRQYIQRAGNRQHQQQLKTRMKTTPILKISQQMSGIKSKLERARQLIGNKKANQAEGNYKANQAEGNYTANQAEGNYKANQPEGSSNLNQGDHHKFKFQSLFVDRNQTAQKGVGHQVNLRVFEPREDLNNISPKASTRKDLEGGLRVVQLKGDLRESCMFEINGKPHYQVDEITRKSRIGALSNMVAKPSNIAMPTVNPYSSSKHSRYYLSEVVRAIHQKNSLAVEHIKSSIGYFHEAKEIMESLGNIKGEPIELQIRSRYVGRKTLVLDLDQTLIHCFESSEVEPDLKISVLIDGGNMELSLTIRPYAISFLKRICEKWEVVIFTASHQDYANAILNEIDPENVIFQHRLYRQHCTCINDYYFKDLSRINRDLKDMVLVDNAAYSYALQPSNGIPILPYYDGKDYQLSALEKYLDKLQNCQDVRCVNSQYFKLDSYTQFDDSTPLIQELYIDHQEQLLK